MKIRSDLEDSALTVVLDLRHPFCFLALGPAIEFGKQQGIAINWLPRQSEMLRPPSSPGPDDDRGVRHRRHRAHMIAREIAVYADAQGLQMKEPYRDAPPEAAHLAWLFMRACAPAKLEAFLAEMFQRYWRLEFDASDLDAAAARVADHGEDAAVFRSWAVDEGQAALERIQAELDEVGAVAVPACVACGQIFLGRQHLPMIQWLLEGETGPIPI